MTKIAIFMHVARMGNWEILHEKMCQSIIKSGLMDNLNKFYVTVVGKGKPLQFPYPLGNKVEILSDEEELQRFEFPIIEEITRFAQHPYNKDFLILKCHNSGSSHGKEGTLEYDDSNKYPDWLWFEMHTKINRWKEHVSELEKGADTTGTEYQKKPCLHWSGNWWWAKTEYINKLLPLEEVQKFTPGGIGSGAEPKKRRHAAEFWIGSSNDKSKWVSLWQSGFSWSQSKETMDEVRKYLSNVKQEEQFWNEN